MLVNAFVLLSCVGFQQSKALFDTPVVVLPADSPPFDRLLDFDGDGFTDAVGHRVIDDGSEVHIAAWQNNGLGGLVNVFDKKTATIPSGLSGLTPMKVAVGDLNGDGLDDFVLAGGNGFIKFEARIGGFNQYLIQESAPVSGVVLEDLDGDSIDDVLVTRHDNSGPSVHILWSSGGDLIAPLSHSFYENDVVAVEADGDGPLDFAVWNRTEAQIYVIDGGAVYPGQSWTWSSTPGMKLAAGDIDGDSDDDLVAYCMPWSSVEPAWVEIFRRVGDVTFIPESPKAGGPAEFLMDLDGDGDLDGVCCGGGGGEDDPEYPLLSFPSTFQMALGDGAGNFDQAFAFAGLGSRQLAGVADLDHDGDLDVVAGRCVHYARRPIVESPAPALAYLNLLILRDDQIGDIDRDGDLDVVPGNAGHYNLGDGAMAYRYQSDPEDPPGKRLSGPVYRGDFNQDGADDFIKSMYDLNYVPARFERMIHVINNGSGQFLIGPPAADPGVEFGIGNYTIDAYLCEDVEGDGDLDLFSRTVDESTKRTRLYLNDGNAYFQFHKEWSSEQVEAVADVDSSGVPDLLLFKGTTGFKSELIVRRGLGSGSFSAPSSPFGSFTELDPRRHIDVGDYDLDGRLDVSVVDGAGAARIWFNASSGPGMVAFQSTDLLSTLVVDGEYPSVKFVDASGDLRPDIVVGPFDDSPNASWIYPRTTEGPGPLYQSDFGTPLMQVIPHRFVADVEGDGDLDFVGTSIVRSSVLRPYEGGGRRMQYGTGSIGPGGIAPILGASGPCRVGEAAELLLSGADADSYVLLVIGLNRAEILNSPKSGLTNYVFPWIAWFLLPAPGDPSIPGNGLMRMAFVPPALAANLGVCHQGFVFSPLGEVTLACTNGLELYYED